MRMHDYAHRQALALTTWGTLAICISALTYECIAQQESSTDDARKYTVTVVPNTAAEPVPLELPDLTRFTEDSVRRIIPAERRGLASIAIASQLPLLDEAFRSARGRDLRRRQATNRPQVILIEGGALSLDQLVTQLDNNEIAENKNGVVTIRLPILVSHGAALIVDGNGSPMLRLSTDRGAFLANAGRLFIIDAFVTSWSESKSQATMFEKKDSFRPFVASYIRSETYVAGSKIQHLGFAAPTAYGFSLSSHPERNLGEPRNDWPTGVLVGNEFRGLYYGFYSFEARDVAIIDNRYVDNIVYGIDPHDRSTRLLIARNAATGTVERHGIIGSREVSHSFIVDNVSHNNSGTGIMLDRQCSHNVVCRNTVYQNEQGVVLYESPSNTVSENAIAFNEKSGVKIRNSVDIRVEDNIIVGNDDYALELAARKLDDHDKRAARGDHYDVAVAADFIGNRVGANRGLAKAINLRLLRLGKTSRDIDVTEVAGQLNVTTPSTRVDDEISFGQELKPLTPQLRRAIDSEGVVLEVKQVDP